MTGSSDVEGRGAEKPGQVFIGLPGIYVNPGAHIAHFFRGVEERLTVLGPFIRAGLDAGNQCIVVTEDPNSLGIEKHLREAGIDIESVLDSGQLIIFEGRSDVEAMTSVFDSLVEQAEAAGRDVIRVGGNMSWALDKMAESRKLLEWEASYDQYVGRRYQLVALCQYDQTRFDGNTIMHVLETHPLSIIGQIVQENPFYRQSDAFIQA